MAAGSPGQNEQVHHPQTFSARRPRKRQHPLVFNGVENTYEDKNNDFLCPICFEIIEAAHMTKCGHSFCYQCLLKVLEHSSRCPKCNSTIDKEQIFPNFLLNELILKHKQILEDKRLKLEKHGGMVSPEFQEMLTTESDSLALSDVNLLLELLLHKKQQLETDSKSMQNQLLIEFLQQVRKRKQEQLDVLTNEIHMIDEDTGRVQNLVKNHRNVHSSVIVNNVSDREVSPTTPDKASGDISILSTLGQDGFNGTKAGGRSQWLQATMATRRKKMHIHFEDLEQCYFSARFSDSQPSTSGDFNSGGLDEFTQSLSKFTRYSGIRPLATLSYASDIFNGSSIVSSIEFDRDNEFFAIAGVTKKIKVFEYGMVIKDTVDMHYPVSEMVCNSKISCVSWSSYEKGLLASSDYEGTVTIWDAFTAHKHRVFQEHEKRCWSVDFNKVDTKLVASGSDDSRVKLWSINMEHSVACLEAKANVCCVKFNPESRFHLAFGSADHCVHYYDLRNPKHAMGVFDREH